ncbi:two-component regulator propeller domain-containing protein [Paludibaculum fermentans]|uniref:two-component regulator propeller domain-containing protein n=1 Tax=Paludibaculum fermentans TaxID=1473598 RepID=UPI003EBDEBD3
MFSAIKLGLAIGVVCTIDRSWALTPAKSISQYVLEHWHVKEGLRQGTVQALAQTPDGYLWLGTRDGIVRFDGVRFRTFRTADTPALKHNNISDLAVGKDGTLWIGQSEGGVTSWRNSELHHFGKNEGLASDSVRSLSMGPDGTLWIGSFGAGVTALKDGKARVFAKAEGVADNTVRAVLGRADGAWIGTDKGVSHIVNGRVIRPEFATELGPVLINAFLEDRRGQLWIGTGGKGLARWTGGRLEYFGAPQGLKGTVVRSIVEDRDGNLWVGTGNALNRYFAGRFESFTTANGLGDNYIRQLLEDREGSLWVGLFGGGLDRLKDGRFVNWSREEGLASDFVFSIREMRSGEIWAATNGGGLSRLTDGVVTPFGAASGMPSDVALSIGEQRDGTPLAGFNHKGLWTWRNGRFLRIPMDAEADQADVLAMAEDGNGALWLTTNAGLRVRRNGVWSNPVAPVADGSDLHHSDLLVRRDGSVWTAGSDGIARLTGSRLEFQRDATGARLPKSHALYEDSAGVLWATTNGQGLRIQLNGVWQKIDGANGMPVEVLYQVLEDAQGQLWMTSDRGVLRASRQELLEAAGHPQKRVRFRLYGLADGLRSSECNGGGGGHPMGWRGRDGRLWIPTVRGVAMVDPSRLQIQSPPPPAVVEEIWTGQRSYLPGQEVTLAPGAGDLEFRYHSLSLRAPEGLRFRYRLDGFDSEWVEAGNRRSAFYTNLPPGRYVFRVEVASNESDWVGGGPITAVELKPHFYETLLFRGLAVLGLILLGVWLARIRAARGRAADHAAAMRVAYQEMEQRIVERTSELDQANHILKAEIAERRGIEEKLRRQKDDYETIFNLAPTQIWIKDTQNRCLRINRQVTLDLGLAPEAVEGRTLEELFPQFAGRYFQDDLEVLRTGAPKLGILEKVNAANGEVRLLFTDKVPRRDAMGETIGVVSFSQDVTDRHRLEEQLRQAQRLESLGRLAGGIAHDFNNLLTVINGYAEVLERGGHMDPRRMQMLSEIRRAGQQAALLTQQLLAFSRSQQLRMEILDLNEIVTSLETILRRLMGESVVLVIEPGTDLCRIEGDAGQAQQVLMNLTLNARDAMPAGGALRIATRNVEVNAAQSQNYPNVPPGAFVELIVADTGEGMDEETQRRLFEPFFSTKEQGRGTGLGLATVYGVVTQSGGHIVVQSVPGLGTTFKILFPAVAAPTGEKATLEAAPPATAHTGVMGGRILLVEDQKDVRFLVRTILEQAGYTVMEAGNVDQAEKIWRQQPEPIDLLLTDVVMPGRSGIELAAWVRQQSQDFPVLLMSGFVDQESMGEEQEAQAARALPMIQKPFNPSDLVASIQRMLAGV